MLTPRHHRVTLPLPDPFGKVVMHALDWGDENAVRTVVCVHGLTRNAHDFDVIARELAAQGYRVFSLDMPGRGDSPWLSEPMHYNYPLYVAACLAFLDNFHLRGVYWIGTSMGGLIGMMLAATQPKRIGKLVMNDIGARISAEGLARIMQYAATLPLRFADQAEAHAYLRKAFEPFGIRDEAVWDAFVEHSITPLADGGFRLKTDPAIAQPLVAAQAQGAIAPVDLTMVWEQVSCPTLIIRGESSDLLAPETVSAMLGANLKAETVTIAGCGHAPSLTTPEQTGPVLRFLSRNTLVPQAAIGV